jgi:hypothetical protein
VELLEDRWLLSTYYVSNTNDSGAGSLRDAIQSANGDATPDNIVFDIPASTAPGLNVPVAGFDPVLQDWTIRLQTPLPAITNTVWIDGYTQAESGVNYLYPGNQAVSTILYFP